jgi:hypothetical protein
MRIALIGGLGLCFCCANVLMAQGCFNPVSLDEYLQCEILAQEHFKDEQYLVKQAAAPSASLNSTALADSSASPDLLGLSASPASFATRSLSPNANDFSGTLNLYAVYALAKEVDPFELRFYERTSNWRRFSVSVDHSMSVDNLKSDLVGNTNTYMAKVVLFGFRDFAANGNHNKVNEVLKTMSRADRDFAQLTLEVIQYLFDHHQGPGEDEITFSGRIKSDFQSVTFTRDDRRAIGNFVHSHLKAQEVVDQGLEKTMKGIQSQLQVAADFTSRLSYSGGANLYRAEVAADKGFKEGKFVSTTNLSYDFQNARSAATQNRQIARVVEQMSVPIKGIARWTDDPILPSLSGEGDFGTNGVPTYKAQFKIVVPVRLGWAAPLTLQYANRTAVGPRADLKVQLGLTFDLDKAIVDYEFLRPPHFKQ